jgi:hypothetical protein
VHQQVVLRQEAGEEHPVPVLVGNLAGEADRLLLATIFEVIAQLPSSCSKSLPQLSLFVSQIVRSSSLTDTQLVQGDVDAGLGHLSCLFDGGFELAAEVGVEGVHEA